MKSTWIKSLVGLTLCLASFGAEAQLSLGAELALPLGDFSTVYNAGFGGTLRYDKSINENLSWTATAGYLSYGSKSLGGGYSATFSMIPINGGVKYYFTESNAGFYGAADLGLFFLTESLSGSLSGSSSATKFGLSPGAGYRMKQFDFSARFNLVPNYNYFNIRVAYVFDK